MNRSRPTSTSPSPALPSAGPGYDSAKPLTSCRNGCCTLTRTASSFEVFPVRQIRALNITLKITMKITDFKEELNSGGYIVEFASREPRITVTRPSTEKMSARRAVFKLLNYRCCVKMRAMPFSSPWSPEIVKPYYIVPNGTPSKWYFRPKSNRWSSAKAWSNLARSTLTLTASVVRNTKRTWWYESCVTCYPQQNITQYIRTVCKKDFASS